MCKSQNLCKGAIVILIWNGFSALATVYDSDGSSTNVQYIHDTLAQDGDTITLPAGMFNWASTLTISKGITLVGLTTTDPVNRTANDRTIIRVFTGTTGNTALLSLTANCRISGVTFRTGQTSVVNSNGMIRSGNGAVPRVDTCHFDDTPYENVGIAAYSSSGLVDHNIFDYRSANNRSQSVFVANTGAAGWGDASWAAPTNFGGSNFLFAEDNCLNNTSGNHFAGVTDGREGGRLVFRHNHCYDIDINSHGTEIGRYRGVRAYEIYGNDFHWSVSTSIGGMRSGVLITHDNTYGGARPERGITLGTYRIFFPVPVFGGSSGDNPWDVNDPLLYASGTAGAGTGTFGSQSRIVDPTANWQTDQWRGYTAKRVSDNKITLIDGNTTNMLFGYWHDGYGGGTLWNSGDQYQIHKVLVSQDQTCRGQGDLITGDYNHPVNATTGMPSWTHQALEPCYSWNNIYTPTGENIDLGLAIGAWAILQEGRDYFNRTPMPGYTPFIYPHPLVTDPPVPSPIPSATVTPSPTPTPTPTPSPTSPPSPTPPPSPAPTPTPTSTPAATQTPQPSSTPTPTPTATATATATARPRHTPKPHPSHGPAKG